MWWCRDYNAVNHGLDLRTGTWTVRGYASKSAHSHVIRWLIDRLTTRICFKVCAPRFCFKVNALKKSTLPRNNPTKLGQLQPTYGHSDRPSYKTKMKTESKMIFYKKVEKEYRQPLVNQSINHRITWECADFEVKTGCADFESYPRTEYIPEGKTQNRARSCSITALETP